ncbi:type II secretion system F family protein [Anaeromyxobacter paludicola]|uniref:Type II secretion system protein GspF domain-containing protein n=1 Tax=Anaeromyxobacter paludicola TaxID=2918171 RepID=A0ABM7X9G2_9BACT|nr:type II secretion system F family protein [Anaeromyxobacter paludicola]BDG08488.1 hypothetical protein AMPC_16010 [Anaeromyxobacter paludicola]
MRLEPTLFAASLLAAGALAAFSASVVTLFARGDVLKRRLRKDLAPEPESASVELKSLLAQGLSPLARIARPVQAEELSRLRLRLAQGGLRGAYASEIYLGCRVFLALCLTLSVFWLEGRLGLSRPLLPAAAVLAFAAGFYGPAVWLTSRIAGRQAAIERALPDSLDLLVTCVEAGLGLDGALQRVTQEIKGAYPLLGAELALTAMEVNAGLPRVEAFRRLAERTGVAELKSLAATLTQTEMFGTSVGLALRIQGDGIRTRRMQRAEERAAYVSVRMTVPLVLFILPSLLAVVVGPAMVNVARSLLPALGAR